MKKLPIVSLSVSFVIFSVSIAFAQTPPSPWGQALKSAAQAAGQVAFQKLSPQLQKLVTESQKLGAPAKQENFLVTKAKEFLAAGNYQPAFDLAGYVLSTLNSKSIDAKKIMADAQAALTKIAQEKLAQTQQNTGLAGQQAQAAQVQADVAKTTEGVQGISGLFGGKK